MVRLPYTAPRLNARNVQIPGLPHAVTQDDVYEGQFIPKGTKIIANMWCVLYSTLRSYQYPKTFAIGRFCVIQRSIPTLMNSKSSAILAINHSRIQVALLLGLDDGHVQVSCGFLNATNLVIYLAYDRHESCNVVPLSQRREYPCGV